MENMTSLVYIHPIDINSSWQELKDKKGKGCCFLILGRTHMLIVHLPFVKVCLMDAAHVCMQFAVFGDDFLARR